MRGVKWGTQSHNRKQITAFAFTCFLGGRLSVCVVFVVLFLLYIVRTLLAVLVGSFSRMSSIYGSNPFKTRSCKQVDPMYYCLDQYIHRVVALHSECFETRVEKPKIFMLLRYLTLCTDTFCRFTKQQMG